VLGAEGVWVLLYGRHLPRALARRGRGQLLVTVVLMVFISLLPRVSGWGHLGGALAGAAAALVLHLQRFGGPAWRWLAWPLLLVVPVGSYAWLSWAQANRPAWKEVEQRAKERQQQEEQRRQEEKEKKQTEDFETKFLHGDSKWYIPRSTRRADQAFDQARPLLDQHPQRRDEKRTRQAARALGDEAPKLASLAGQLDRTGPYEDVEVEEARKTARDYIRARAELFRHAERRLRRGEKWTVADERQEAEVDRLEGRWRALVR
jgi:hypothetical protein